MLGVATWGAGLQDVFEEPCWSILLERVDDSAVRVSYEQLANIAWVQLQREQLDELCLWILGLPEVWDPEGSHPPAVQVKGRDISVCVAEEGPVEHGVGHQGGDAGTADA